MSIITPNLPTGFTIFCDDFRREDNGKLIYIGVYGADMIFKDQLPALLPTFCALITYREAPGDSSDPVVLKLFIPGNEQAVVTADIPVEQMRNLPLPPPAKELTPILTAMIPIKISPLIIQQEGLIKMRAYRGEDEIRLGSLRVRSVPQPSS